MSDKGITRIVSTQEFRQEIEWIRHQVSSIDSYQQEIRHTVNQLDKHIRMLDNELKLQREILMQLLPEYSKLSDESSSKPDS
jgi:peptidoglycan hydrolase CwlO-like protein